MVWFGFEVYLLILRKRRDGGRERDTERETNTSQGFHAVTHPQASPVRVTGMCAHAHAHVSGMFWTQTLYLPVCPALQSLAYLPVTVWPLASNFQLFATSKLWHP